MKLQLNKLELSESRLRIYSFVGIALMALALGCISYSEKRFNVHDPTFLILLLGAGGLFIVAALFVVTSSVGAIILAIQSRRIKLWNLLALAALAYLAVLINRFLQAD